VATAVVRAAPAREEGAPRSVHAAALRRLARDPAAVIGAAIVAIVATCAIFAPLITRVDPNAQDLTATLVPPVWIGGGSHAHLLGTDNLGRDLLARIIWGSRIVLTVSPLATLCAYLVGCTMGLLAGYYRGWVDTVLMQVCNVILSFPVLLLYVIIMMKFGPSALNIVVAVTFVASPQVARLGLPATAYALMGFSQGAMTALFTGLRRTAAPRAILAYSGALLAPEALAGVRLLYTLYASYDLRSVHLGGLRAI